MSSIDSQTIVETAYGAVQGAPGRRNDVMVFKGIPYAKPPVGPLRWKDPEPPETWEGIRPANEFGPVGPQLDTPAIQATGLPMDEDCLYLNIWTPDTEKANPVLVWIYGGGFQEGTSADPNFDGENLARKGVVVVNFNYRLGVLGFLATRELSAESGHGASGNYGFLDCIAALQWVHDNIAAFGGDPNRVTIAGQSAGAGTCDFLAMSPLAKGLFHRVIAQSHARYSRDTELRYLSTSYRNKIEAEDAGEQFAKNLCKGEQPTLERLRSIPWQKLTDSKLYGDVAVDTGSDSKPPLFRPVVDGWAIPPPRLRLHLCHGKREPCRLHRRQQPRRKRRRALRLRARDAGTPAQRAVAPWKTAHPSDIGILHPSRPTQVSGYGRRVSEAVSRIR